MSSKAELRGNIAEVKAQLDEVNRNLKDKPDNAEFQAFQTELQEMLSGFEAELSALAGPGEEVEAEAPKSSTANKPAGAHGTESKHTFKVNDEVVAKWVSGDKGFYPAKIVSITGPPHNQVFAVAFKGYNDTDTLRLGDIRPLHDNSKKRKADASVAMPGSGTSTPTPASSSTTGVITAAANINQELANKARKTAAGAADDSGKGDKVYKKIRSNKQLAKGQADWKAFSQNKMGKMYKKDSMFRIGEGHNARVGIIGSGQAMQKDPSRSRNYRDGRAVAGEGDTAADDDALGRLPGSGKH